MPYKKQYPTKNGYSILHYIKHDKLKNQLYIYIYMKNIKYFINFLKNIIINNNLNKNYLGTCDISRISLLRK